MREVKTQGVSGGSARASTAFIRPRYFWISAFVFCCLLALMAQKLILPLVPAMHGGHGLLINDAILYHNVATEIAERIGANGWSEWEFYPKGFSGNLGALSALYAVFGPDPAVFIPLNVAAHVTGGLMLYLMGPLLRPGRAGKLGGLVAAILFVIFPSTLLWYSQNLKDSFTIAGTLMLLYSWIRIQAGDVSLRRVLPTLLVAIGGLVLILAMRPYLAVITAAGFALSWIIGIAFGIARKSGRLERGKSGVVLLFLVVVGCGAWIGIKIPAASSELAKMTLHPGVTGVIDVNLRLSEISGRTSKEDGEKEIAEFLHQIETLDAWKWNSIDAYPEWIDKPVRKISELRVHFIAHALSVGAASGIDADRAPSDVNGALAYLPRALVVGVLAPFPNTWSGSVSVPRLAVAVETFISYLFLVGVLLLLVRFPSRALFTGVSFAISLILIYSYVNPNVGTLCRVRFGYWMFLLTCGAVGWASVLLPLVSKMANRGQTSISRDGATQTGEMEGSIGPCSVGEGGMGRIASAGSLALILTLAGFLGFLARDLLLINMRGMSLGLDAFFSAVMLPMVFVNCLAVPLGDVITKPFLRAYESGDQAAGRQIIRRFLGVAALVMGGAAALVFVLSPLGIRAVLSTNDADAIAEGTLYVRLFAPIVFLSAWTMLGNCVLNGLHQAGQAAAVQLVVPFCAILAILLSEPDMVLYAGIGGMVIGTFLNAVLLLLLCGRSGIFLWPSFSKEPFPEPILRPYVWLVFAAVFTAVAVPVNYAFASSVGSGSVSAWAFASKIIVLFTGLFSISITAVVLPHLARMFEHQKNATGRDHFYFLVVAGTWLGGFISVGISLFAEPLVFALFMGGGVSDEQSLTMAHVLRIGAVQIPVMIVGAIVLKSAVISGASFKTVVAAGIALLTNVAVNLLLVPHLGIEGIAFGALAFTMVATFSLATTNRAHYGTSLSVPFILLVGWGVWSWVVVAVHNGSVRELVLAGVGIAALAFLHWMTWTRNLHHRRSLRA